jgi:glycosyltransferase involved in cell wall biosynthesis
MNTIGAVIVSTVFLILRKPDLSVISVPPGEVGLGAIIACRLARVKTVVDYRDEWEDFTANLAKNKFEKFFYSEAKSFSLILYAQSQLVVAVTTRFANALELRGLPKVTIVPNGADVKTFTPSNDKVRSPNTEFKIFYSGGIGKYYRLEIVLKAVKFLVNKGLENVMLSIAGQGDISGILSFGREIGILSNVKYEGIINSKVELSTIISKADVGLIPYDGNPLWKNSIPAKFFEYCSCGIPVIATVYEDSLLAEIISKYKIGLISPPLNEEKLADVIWELYTNVPFREAAGKRARLLIEENFDRNKIAEEFLSLIRA